MTEPKITHCYKCGVNLKGSYYREIGATLNDDKGFCGDCNWIMIQEPTPDNLQAGEVIEGKGFPGTFWTINYVIVGVLYVEHLAGPTLTARQRALFFLDEIQPRVSPQIVRRANPLQLLALMAT